jgi:hypothetical protein
MADTSTRADTKETTVSSVAIFLLSLNRNNHYRERNGQNPNGYARRGEISRAGIPYIHLERFDLILHIVAS